MAKIPDSIDKYKIESLIATGGMGAVFKAMHPTLKRPVILKKLTLSGGASLAERFRREARILMDFRHDNIVDVYDHFKQGSSYYIVLEYVDGESLDGLIKKQRYLETPVAAFILLQCAIALLYAHKKHVIHRDIKPANILISKKGDIKLVDFGIAVSAEDTADGLTREGMTLGTPSYMAPEQFQNTKNVDKRADIYSLGVMVYESLTGKKPFPGGFSPELIHQIQRGKCKSPRAYNPGIDSRMVRIIRKLMHSKPRRRYQDLEKLILHLKKYLARYDSDEIRKRLVAQVRGEKTRGKIHASNYVLFKHKALMAVASAVLVVGIVFGLHLSGFFAETFRKKTHGLVQFEVNVPVSSQPLRNLYVQTLLFHDDDDKIPDVKNGSVLMLPNIFSSSGGMSFISLPTYLRTGAYRAKIVYEDNVFWESFFIQPREVQKTVSSESNGRLVNFVHQNRTNQPVRFTYSAYDIITGKALTGNVNILIKKDGAWIPFDVSKPSTFPLTGSVNYFQFSLPGYQAKYFSLFIAGDQSSCNIDAGLYPLMWKLTIRKPKSVDVLLNTQPFYYTSGGTLKKEKIPSSEVIVFSLPDGQHVLRFTYKGTSINYTLHTADIERRKYSELNIVIDRNSDKNPIVVSKK